MSIFAQARNKLPPKTNTKNSSADHASAFANISYRRAFTFLAFISVISVVICLAVTTVMGVSVKSPKQNFFDKFIYEMTVLAIAVTGSILFSYFVSKRKQWSLARIAWSFSSLISFYVVYTCYRNIKGLAPLGNKQNFDAPFEKMDSFIFGGRGADQVLSQIFPAGSATQFIDFIYISYLDLVFYCIILAVILLPSLRLQLFFMVAYLGNWFLAALTYWTFPALGPAFVRAQDFSWMDNYASDSAKLQDSLYRKYDLAINGTDVLQGIGAFPSLHTSVTITWALILSWAGYTWLSRIAWGYCGFTLVATLLFGFHYSIDLVAGAAIAFGCCFAAKGYSGLKVDKAKSSLLIKPLQKLTGRRRQVVKVTHERKTDQL